MPHIHRPPAWRLPGRKATPERVFLDRRAFLKRLGMAGLGAYGFAAGCGPTTGDSRDPAEVIHNYARTTVDLYPAARNPAHVLDRPLTDETAAATYNNFYEFTLNKGRVWRLVKVFSTDPWTVTVDGLVDHPRAFALEDLARAMPLEERLYRHRCVEAWSMDVPWTGFPLRVLADRVGVQDEARFVRFESFFAPHQAPNQYPASGYRWPYYEALRIDEALHDLTLLATGIYGHPLPKQHGAPIRLVVPWKYGFKSAKSLVRITFTADRPGTFWNDVEPGEYGFLANVDPGTPHPRWSQASEQVLGSGDEVPTRPYNGYGELVANLYG